MPALLDFPPVQQRRLLGVVAALFLILCSSPLAQARSMSSPELDDPALRAVNAQGLADQLLASLPVLAALPAPDDALEERPELPLPLRLLNPLLAYLDADVQIRGLQAPQTRQHADGTLEFRMVGSIEEIRFDNLRVLGAPVEQRFGSLRLEQVDFAGSSLRIRQLP